ncbi:CadC family transcriptional regulator [Shewanella sp. UCD-FRSSP16_17]|uniref:winged helix-turn-helix domain-containing protein n=1 Tax=Shewanella sp. UCD-FRSSP16_17 TaxID=1853256 RepID=UPI0007EE9C4F|nr:winged helix-turn-helix domain-containing protein [Shewanella sp. UCD-FRSSP16_17]OBT10020.1 CadC family transcriptional regulator [Shewanella sp. UCD-FRSSP16_17]
MINITSYLKLAPDAKQLIDRTNNQVIDLTFSESAVLAHLFIEPGAISTKDSLVKQGWPGRVVSDSSLTQCISTLRKKLEPYSEVQLKTIARRGYQIRIVAKSHVTMLAVNDPQSIKAALFDVSLLIKVAGVVFAIIIIAYQWYYSDYHQVLKRASSWNAHSSISLNIGGVKESVPVLYPKNKPQPHASLWQKHLAPESNESAHFEQFKGFALADDNIHSFAVCLDFEESCIKTNTMNIAATDETPAGLNMEHFYQLRDSMENRIRVNREILPVDYSDGEIDKHHYFSDVYFPVADKLLIRVDMGLSMIYEAPLSGQFYYSICLTDEDCRTTPIKYKLRGDFEQYRQSIGDIEVDVFQVKVKQKNIILPEQVSESAMSFYRGIRKHHVKDKELYFYRLYHDNGTAVWIIPLFKNIITWTRYEKVSL